MNHIEHLQKLAGIKIVEGATSGVAKYAGKDKADLKEAKKQLTSVLLQASRASFKYKNAEEELRCVEAELKKLDDAEKAPKEEVKEEVAVEDTTAITEDCKDEDKKDSDDEDEDKDSKKEDKSEDSDEKDDKKDSKEEKSDDKEDKDSKKDEKDEDSEKEEKSDDKEDDKEDSDKDEDESDDKEDKKESKEEKSDDKEDEKVKESTEESIESIVARIMSEEVATSDSVKTDEAPVAVKPDASKVRVPLSVKSSVTKRIGELEKAIKNYPDDEGGVKVNAVDALKKILELVSTDGVKAAQIHFGTLMSPIVDSFPPDLVNWLAKVDNPLVNDKD